MCVQFIYVFVCSGCPFLKLCLFCCMNVLYFIQSPIDNTWVVSLLSFVYCFIASLCISKSIISMFTSEETEAQRS